MLLPYLHPDVLEAGCDEAGRGCLAGPVYAAAVILPKDFNNEVLNDSKQLTEKQRYALRPVIEQQALAWSVGVVEAWEIDKLNILNASFLAMHRAIHQLFPQPGSLLIDGNRFRVLQAIPLHKLPQHQMELDRFARYPNIPHTCVVKGDGRYLSIAAASILAKTYRDDYMNHLHEQDPRYEWNTNKGYPTEAHRKAIRRYGPSEHHRKTFQGLDKQLELDF